MDYNNLYIQNQTIYDTLKTTLECIRPTVYAISERMQPIMESVEILKKEMGPTIESLNNLKMKLNPLIENVSHSILESIPNIRVINEQCKSFYENYCAAIEQLMKTLDFPVIQPEITEEQLEKRLRQMDGEEIDVVKTAVSTMVKSAPIEPEKKSKILTYIKSTGKEVFTGVAIEIIVAIIMFLFGCDNNIQNTEINNTVINNYSYSYDLNIINYNNISSYEIHYNEDSNQKGNTESHSIKE